MNRRTSLKSLTGFLATLSLGHVLPNVALAQVPAQAWPQRTVHLIVPFGAGSATDVTARLFADRLAKRWGQSVVVENRPGADSILGGSFDTANQRSA